MRQLESVPDLVALPNIIDAILDRVDAVERNIIGWPCLQRYILLQRRPNGIAQLVLSSAPEVPEPRNLTEAHLWLDELKTVAISDLGIPYSKYDIIDSNDGRKNYFHATIAIDGSIITSTAADREIAIVSVYQSLAALTTTSEQLCLPLRQAIGSVLQLQQHRGRQTKVARAARISPSKRNALLKTIEGYRAALACKIPVLTKKAVFH